MRPRPGSPGVLPDAPRMQAVGTPHVEEMFCACGYVRVHSRALLAGREGLPIDAPFNKAILNVHHVLRGCTIITLDRQPSSRRLHSKMRRTQVCCRAEGP
jgi:hypothetical protein